MTLWFSCRGWQRLWDTSRDPSLVSFHSWQAVAQRDTAGTCAEPQAQGGGNPGATVQLPAVNGGDRGHGLRERRGGVAGVAGGEGGRQLHLLRGRRRSARAAGAAPSPPCSCVCQSAYLSNWILPSTLMSHSSRNGWVYRVLAAPVVAWHDYKLVLLCYIVVRKVRCCVQERWSSVRFTVIC